MNAINKFFPFILLMTTFYLLGDESYLMLLAFMFFALSILKYRFRAQNFVFLSILLIAVSLIFTSSISTVVLLIQSNIKFIQDSNVTLTNIFTDGTGQEVLPSRVRQMLSMLSANNIPSYQLSNQLSQNEEIRQRIIEAAWPIKLENDSPYLFIYSNEVEDNTRCNFIDKRKDLELVYCN